MRSNNHQARRVRLGVLMMPLVGSLVLAGCMLFTRMQWVTVAGIVSGQTETVDHLLEVAPDMRELSLRFRGSCREGRAQFTLIDPTGATRMRTSLAGGGSCEQSGDYAPIPGTWTFRRELVGFSGQHSVKLGATGGDKLTITVTDVRVVDR